MYPEANIQFQKPVRKRARRQGATSQDHVLDAAASLIAGGDASALTCSSLAMLLHIRPPSLYKHFESLDAVRDGLAVRALKELTELARAAICGRSGRDALEALADAQRVYAHANPGMYEVAVRRAAVNSPDSSRALEAFLRVELATLRAYGLTPDEAARMSRCLRASIWGFISLELRDPHATSFEADQSFDRLIDILDSGARLTAKAQTVGLKLALASA